MQKQSHENVPPKKFVLDQINKNFKEKIVFITCFQLYFLTNEITSVHDWGAYFIEYVFEFYFLRILRFKSLNATEAEARLTDLRLSFIFKITQSIFQLES